MKKVGIIISSLIFFVTLLTTLTAISFAQEKAKEIIVEAKEVEYVLPYPGVLPDSPLYFLKSLRDNVWLFSTRERIKKANLLLLFSDKKVAMAQSLSTKGQWNLGSKTALEAEKNFEEMIKVLKTSKKIGTSATPDYIQKITLSNQKHRQVFESLLSKIPQGERLNIEAALKLNKKLEKELKKM